jgi:hypothetical protein
MHHLVQQRVVVGKEYFVMLGKVERDGSATRAGIIGTECQPLTEWLIALVMTSGTGLSAPSK